MTVFPEESGSSHEPTQMFRKILSTVESGTCFRHSSTSKPSPFLNAPFRFNAATVLSGYVSLERRRLMEISMFDLLPLVALRRFALFVPVFPFKAGIYMYLDSL